MMLAPPLKSKLSSRERPKRLGKWVVVENRDLVRPRRAHTKTLSRRESQREVLIVFGNRRASRNETHARLRRTHRSHETIPLWVIHARRERPARRLPSIIRSLERYKTFTRPSRTRFRQLGAFLEEWTSAKRGAGIPIPARGSAHPGRRRKPAGLASENTLSDSLQIDSPSAKQLTAV